jgi:hypothetical protein
MFSYFVPENLKKINLTCMDALQHKVPFTRYLREQNKEKTILVILNKVYSSLANHKHLLEVLIRVLTLSLWKGNKCIVKPKRSPLGQRNSSLIGLRRVISWKRFSSYEICLDRKRKRWPCRQLWIQFCNGRIKRVIKMDNSYMWLCPDQMLLVNCVTRKCIRYSN